MLLSFPSDEVGNGILDEDTLNKSKYNLSFINFQQKIKIYQYTSKTLHIRLVVIKK